MTGGELPAERIARPDATSAVDDWLSTVDPDPRRHHFVDIIQEPAAELGRHALVMRAVCTCGWSSVEHQLHGHGTSAWAQEQAWYQLQRSGIAHVRSVTLA